MHRYYKKCIHWLEILINGAIVEAKMTSPNVEGVVMGQRE